ncbi:MAG: transporter [Candidatus Rokubacteria bacterium]|nr:transporter [Candidatus Rokubacteria bacterium]
MSRLQFPTTRLGRRRRGNPHARWGRRHGGLGRPLALLLLGLLALDWVAGPSAASAFPINAPNARTLFGGFTLGSFRLRVTREATLKEGTETVSDPRDQSVMTFEEDFTLVYGATRDLTVGATLHIVERRLRFDDPAGGRRTLSADGLGDLTLVGAYRFFRRDVERGTTQFSFLGGLKLPTGATDIDDSDLPRLTGGTETRLPPSLQLGSGSVDGIVGLAGFHNMNRLSFYADVQGKLNSEGSQDFRAGNQLHYDLSADYVLLPGRNMFLILELNGVLAERAEQAGRTVRDSGGHLLFLSPGIQYLPIPPLILEAGVQIPILRDLNGRQLAPDWSVVVGLRYLF